jgi:hypothetical protein
MMFAMAIRIAFLALAVLLAGCGASGQPFATASIAPPKSGAVLYIYRAKTIIGIGNPDVSFVHLDGKPLTRLRIGGYLALPLKPGPHEILATTSLLGADTGNVRAKAVVNVPPGGKIFVRYTEAYKGFVPIILPKVGAVITQYEFRFEEVSEGEALGELANTKALELDKPS